jgi:hypothetical protein
LFIAINKVLTTLLLEPNLEVKHFGIARIQSITGTYGINLHLQPSLIGLDEPSINNNRMEELNTNTTELSRQFSCHHCSIFFTPERLYNKHENEVHKLESNNQQFHCQICDITFISVEIYHNHLLQVHGTILRPLLKRTRSKPNRSIEPNPEDPNFYCKSCTTKYATEFSFRIHLRYVHKIVDLPLKGKRRPKPNHNIESNPNDPSFYCKSCSTEYPSLGTFRKHIREVHKMILKPLIKRPIPNHSIIPDIDYPNFYCKSYSSKYVSRGVFRAHLRRIHNMTLAPPLKKNSVKS